jgi:radical SAM protein with 4Fe4S-binding SPASM domain
VLDLAASFGCDVAFGFFIPTGRGLCNQDRLTLTTKQMVELFERAAAKRRRSLGLPENPQRGEDPRMAFTGVRTDCSVDTILTIQADGSLLPCPNLNQPEHRLGNVLEMDDAELEAMLASPTGKECYRCRRVDEVPGCRRCEARYFCGGGCMANAYMVTRDLYGKDPYCGFYREMWRRHGPLRGEYRSRRAAAGAAGEGGDDARS